MMVMVMVILMAFGITSTKRSLERHRGQHHQEQRQRRIWWPGESRHALGRVAHSLQQRLKVLYDSLGN